MKDKYINMVKSRVDIAQLVIDLSPSTILRQSGSHRRKCCCVFHEKCAPSLILDMPLNCNKCFGCGKAVMSSDQKPFKYTNIGSNKPDYWQKMSRFEPINK